MKKYLLVLSLFAGYCTKESDAEISPADSQKAETFRSTWNNRGFQITDYYSLKPIDYDGDGDTETDLKPYISFWLTDDSTVISGDQATVYQNKFKIPVGMNSSFPVNFKVLADVSGVGIDFVNDDYYPTKYRLTEFTDSSFTIYTDKNGNTVYSVFESK